MAEILIWQTRQTLNLKTCSQSSQVNGGFKVILGCFGADMVVFGAAGVILCVFCELWLTCIGLRRFFARGEKSFFMLRMGYV